MTPPPRSRREMPIRERVGGVIPYIPEFASPKTGLTPSKLAAKKIEGKNVDKVILDRWETCTGRPAKIYKFFTRESKSNSNRRERFRRHCDLCKKQLTCWYCIQCKGWYCMDARPKADNFALMKVCMPITKSKDEIEEEEKEKRIEEHRREKRRKAGKELTAKQGSSKKKRKTSSSDNNVTLQEYEYFEDSCWITRHKCAWVREDGTKRT